MKYLLCIILVILSFVNSANSQDTFSITAVDPITGQVGSAGASCVTGCIMLSDVHPGVGVIHTQAYYLSSNQNYAKSLMNLGLSPQQIIDSMVAHDAQNNPTKRQYGIVDLVNGGRTAAYTGVNCDNYKNHIIGPTYTIQGNILLGQKVLDSMNARFLRTTGSLADKLMAALQGAKMIGADTRCTSRNTSSISAFIRVAKPNDPLNSLYLDLNVNNTPVNKDPIDSLQVLYNQWLLTNINFVSNEIPNTNQLYQNFPNPFNSITKIKFDIKKSMKVSLKIYNILGEEIHTLVSEILAPGTYDMFFNSNELPSGIYFYVLTGENFIETKKFILIK